MEEYSDYFAEKRRRHFQGVFTAFLDDLRGKDVEGIFTQPVDLSAVRGYLVIITRPMDFEKMSYKVRDFGYESYACLKADFRLIIDNAKKFNHESTDIFRKACELEEFGTQQITEARFAEMLAAQRQSEIKVGDPIRRQYVREFSTLPPLPALPSLYSATFSSNRNAAIDTELTPDSSDAIVIDPRDRELSEFTDVPVRPRHGVESDDDLYGREPEDGDEAAGSVAGDKDEDVIAEVKNEKMFSEEAEQSDVAGKVGQAGTDVGKQEAEVLSMGTTIRDV